MKRPRGGERLGGIGTSSSSMALASASTAIHISAAFMSAGGSTSSGSSSSSGSSACRMNIWQCTPPPWSRTRTPITSGSAAVLGGVGGLAVGGTKPPSSTTISWWFSCCAQSSAVLPSGSFTNGSAPWASSRFTTLGLLYRAA